MRHWSDGLDPTSDEHRPIADLVVALFAVTIVLVVLIAVIGGVVWKIVDPDNADLSALIGRVGDLVNTLIGAVVGYLAGKGVRNGSKGEG